MNGWLDLRFTRAPVLHAESQLARTLSLSAAAAFVCMMAIALWLQGRDRHLVMGRAVCEWLGWNPPGLAKS